MKQKTSVKNLEIEKLKQTFLKKRNVIKKRFYLEKKAIKTCKKISQITDEFLISIFNFIKGDKTYLEREPFSKITKKKQLIAFKHKGFWQCMDTQREVELLNNIWNNGRAPWLL